MCSINLFICFMLSFFFGLLALLTFSVVDVVVAFSFLKFILLQLFWFFYVFLLFCWLSVLCCLCCHCLFEPYYLFAIITLYLFLLLFSLLAYCVSNSSYCHRYLYDIALILLVWLLTLLVYISQW